jgi:hypothetical protein
VFFHLLQHFHYDFNDNLGFHSGLGIRNVAMIEDETLPPTETATEERTIWLLSLKRNTGG